MRFTQKLRRCTAQDGKCPCGLIWFDQNFATKLWTANDFSKASNGAEDEGLTDEGAIELSNEIIRRWNAQHNFFSRLINLFGAKP